MAWRVGFVSRFEKSLLASGFLMPLKDGAHDGAQKGTLPVRTPLKEPSFYTRKYRLVLDGVPVSTIVKFVYNLRDGWADFDIYYKRFADGVDMSKEAADKKLDSLVSLEDAKESKAHG